MKKIIFIFFILINFVMGDYIKAGYDISFGIFGKVGQSEITYTRDKDNYIILVHAWTIGTPAALTQNRTETFISQGKIINGILRPDVFLKYRQSDRRIQYRLFLFNHEKKTILEQQSKDLLISRSKFDVATMKIIKYEENKYTFSEQPFKLYAKDDLLSLFFNTQTVLKTLKDGECKSFAAVGSKTEGCLVDIELPTGVKKQELEALMLGQKGRLVTIIIHQDIFKSKKGELHVIFDKEGLANDVLLKDVVMFGDVRGKRAYIERD